MKFKRLTASSRYGNDAPPPPFDVHRSLYCCVSIMSQLCVISENILQGVLDIYEPRGDDFGRVQ